MFRGGKDGKRRSTMNFASRLDFYTRMIPSAKQRALASRMHNCIRRAHSDRGGLWSATLAPRVELREVTHSHSADAPRCLPPTIAHSYRPGARS